MLYLYGIVDPAPGEAVGCGLAGEPLRICASGGLSVVVGEVAAAPAATADALREHDAVVRRLAAAVSAVLPMRFGQTVADAKELASHLTRWAASLPGALDLVRDCEQMTLRYRIDATAPRAPSPSPVGAGPGTRYLAERLRTRRPPELAALLQHLQPWVRSERIDAPRDGTIAVHMLVPRADRERWRQALDEAAASLEPGRMVASGPWPVYAFSRAWER